MRLNGFRASIYRARKPLHAIPFDRSQPQTGAYTFLPTKAPTTARHGEYRQSLQEDRPEWYVIQEN